jgi:hypothetical protein
MINDKNKKQEGGEGSSNIQAESVNVYNTGISYTDAKEIALDVFKTNFIHLKNEAAQIAAERAEEITENIFKTLSDKHPEALKEFEQPAMQDALFTAQKEYAKSGDKDLGDLLADIIVDRAKVSKRNMLQIVLDESLTIASKLTVEQLDTLTLIFLLLRTQRKFIGNYNEFKTYLIEEIFPFVDNLINENEHYNYLEYLRCGHIRTGNYGKLEHNLGKTYKGLFSKGFTMDEIEKNFPVDKPNFQGLLIPCFHDVTKFQIGVLDDKTLDQRMNEKNYNPSQISKTKQFFNKTTLSDNEIKELLKKFDSKMKKVFDIWDISNFNHFELSQVGIAIAHANYRRRTGKTMNLSMWIK